MNVLKRIARTGLRQTRNNSGETCSKPVVWDPSYKCGPVTEKIRAKQKLFQADNDLPVYIKGGKVDLFMYRFTCLAVSIGFIDAMIFAYKMANGLPILEKDE